MSVHKVEGTFWFRLAVWVFDWLWDTMALLVLIASQRGMCRYFRCFSR
ncbi:protein of unknown function [Shewanella benthica]|uniref:Uncharacterized protein n=1 Tax=Shewanella benthica TaxID=43661 RepID=A0A330M057_9GAMM|nr:protein of unknown function [Shewanella benthica]